MRQSSTHASGVQNSVNSSLSDFSGRNEVILRWDPHGKFIRFNDGNEIVDHLMINYSKAKRWFDNHCGGFDSILESHQTLTITGTESDEKTTARPRWEVVDFLGEIDRFVRYIPDWCWTYDTMSDEKLEGAIDSYVERVKWFYEQKECEGLDHVEFIPLAKGLGGRHYAQAVDQYDVLGVNRIGMYGVQTPSITKFVQRVEQAIQVFDPDGILVIGKQSPQDVSRLPKRVDGTAGFWNWKEACGLTADGYSIEDLETWYNNIQRIQRHGGESIQTSLNISRAEVRSDGWR
jgi:hypothetical protein